MKYTIGGSLFCCDGPKYDYNLRESVENLLEFCDEVAVTVFSPEDREQLPNSDRLKVCQLPRERFDETKGFARLAYWTNFTKENLNTDYHFNLQADEIVHEESFPVIREAIETGVQAFLCRRFNLWGDPYHYLTVDHNRLPCSDYVIRLAKIAYESHGDAESLKAPPVPNFAEKIRIYHMGFVRKREVMPTKIRRMASIFETEPDKKLEGMEVFQPEAWFKGSDLTPIIEALPKGIQKWAEERSYGERNPRA